MSKECHSNHLGSRIRARIKELGLTQKEVALAAGLLPQSITDYVKGRCDPKFGSIRSLASVLGVSPAWFFEDVSEMHLDSLGWCVVNAEIPRAEGIEHFTTSGYVRECVVCGHPHLHIKTDDPDSIVSGHYIRFDWVKSITTINRKGFER